MIDTFFAGSAASAATALLGLGQRLTPGRGRRPGTDHRPVGGAQAMTWTLLVSLLVKSSLVSGAGLACARFLTRRPVERVDILRATVCLLLALPVIMNVLPALDLALLPASPPPAPLAAPTALATIAPAPHGGAEPIALACARPGRRPVAAGLRRHRRPAAAGSAHPEPLDPARPPGDQLATG
jgi:hypothetical protein